MAWIFVSNLYGCSPCVPFSRFVCRMHILVALQWEHSVCMQSDRFCIIPPLFPILHFVLYVLRLTVFFLFIEFRRILFETIIIVCRSTKFFCASIRQTTTKNTDAHTHAHNDRSWIWCVMRFFSHFPSHINVFVSNGTKYEAQKMESDSFSSLVMCQQFGTTTISKSANFSSTQSRKPKLFSFHELMLVLPAVFAYIIMNRN